MLLLPAVRCFAAPLDNALQVLATRHAYLWLALALLPMLAILLFPSGFAENESQYLMLAHRQVAPEAFSFYSAAFDNTHARLLTQLLMGSVVQALGYDSGQKALRVLMMLLYAASLAYLLTALTLSVLEAVLALAVYGLVGPALIGAEWLFIGVESKTFAYAAVFLGLGLYWRDRRWSAVAAMVLATYLHFLVGGFWMAALLLLIVLHAGSLRPAIKPLGAYVIAVLPMLAILINDQYVVNAAAIPAHGMSADYLYAVVRVPHHASPFTNLYLLGYWIHGILASAGLLCAFLLLSAYAGEQRRPLHLWLALLLVYLLLAVAISAFDVHSGAFGKFLPFRPSALTLFLCIIAFVLAFRELADTAGLRNTLAKAVFVTIVPIFLWAAAKDHIKAITLGSGYPDLPQLLAFLNQHAGAEDIVLTDPEVDMQPIGADLPRLIRQPTLVSFKFVPSNPKDLYRWWDLLQFRKAVYAGSCPGTNQARGTNDPKVRFVLQIDRPEGEEPRCGRTVFRSRHFVLAELSPTAR